MINMSNLQEVLRQKYYCEVLNSRLKPLIEIDKRKHLLKEVLTWPLEFCFAEAILCPFYHDSECFFWTQGYLLSRGCFYKSREEEI